MRKIYFFILICFIVDLSGFSQVAKRKPKINKIKAKNTIKKKQLSDYNKEYQDKKTSKTKVAVDELLKRNMRGFLNSLRTDLGKEQILGKIVIRNLNFSSVLKAGEFDNTILEGFFSTSNKKGSKFDVTLNTAIVFIPNRYKNKIFITVNMKGAQIDKGLTKGDFTKIVKREKADYYGDVSFIFLNGKLKMMVYMYNKKKQIIFNKTYTQRYKQYGILKYKNRYIRLGLGVDMFYPGLVSNDFVGKDSKIPLYFIPNIFLGAFIDKVGSAGLQIDLGIIDKVDFVGVKGYFNWDIMETATSTNPPIHVMTELSMGAGVQFLDKEDYSASFFSFGFGLRFILLDTFYLRSGVEMFLNKSKADNGSYIIHNPVMPLSVNFGLGYYIL